MGKLQGPLLYDSLDKDNAGTTTKTTKEPNTTAVGVTAVIALATLLGLFFVYVIRTLEYKAAVELSQAANVALVLLYFIAIVSITIALIGGAWYAVLYLRRVAKVKGMLNLQDGPHYDVDNLLSDARFDKLADRLYDVLEKRAAESRYQGVTTLTLDESTTYNQKKVEPATDEKPLEEVNTVFGLEILNDINGEKK